jgi:hypothetical protein
MEFCTMTRRILLLSLCFSLFGFVNVAFANNLTYSWSQPPATSVKGTAYTPKVEILNIPNAATVASATITIYDGTGAAVKTYTATTISQTAGSNQATVTASGAGYTFTSTGAYSLKVKWWKEGTPLTDPPDYTSPEYSINVISD